MAQFEMQVLLALALALALVKANHILEGQWWDSSRKVRGLDG